MFSLLMLVVFGAAAIVVVKETAAKRERDRKRVSIRTVEQHRAEIRRRRR